MDGSAGLRDELVATALMLLEESGEEPSLRGVARAAGVSAMAPYRHFPDKAALLAAVADRGFAFLRDDLVAADAQPDPGEALFAQGMTFIDFARRHPALFRLMYDPRHGCDASPAAEAAGNILAQRVAGLLPSRPAAGVLACRALVQGMAMLALGGRLRTADPGAVADAVRLFVQGIASPSPRQG